MREFSSLLSYELLHNPYPDVTLEDTDTTLPFLGDSMQADDCSNSAGNMTDISPNTPSINIVDMSTNIADNQDSCSAQTDIVSKQHTRTEYGHAIGQNGA
eukprot:10279422-Ditylum_brightwellii.AAC.1